MTNKIIVGLGFALVSAGAIAQMGAPPSSSPPSSMTPGTESHTTDSTTTTTTTDTSATASVGFSTMDKNSDGKISRAEAHSDMALNKKFKSLDTDKDGQLSMSEFASFTP